MARPANTYRANKLGGANLRLRSHEEDRHLSRSLSKVIIRANYRAADGRWDGKVKKS